MRTPRFLHENAYHDFFRPSSPPHSSATVPVVSPDRYSSDDDDDDETYMTAVQPSSIPAVRGSFFEQQMNRDPLLLSPTELFPPTTRTVSPPLSHLVREESPSSSENNDNDNETGFVYVADSMRGNYYHVNSSCYGLRTATGTCRISKIGATLRGMRLCKVCRPSSLPQTRTSLPTPGRLQEEEEEEDDGWEFMCNDPVVTPETSRSGHSGVRNIPSSSRTRTSPAPSGTESTRTVENKVYVASSMKGKCFHSYSSCPGLRSARGVSSISPQRADTMCMRPCKLCKPTNHDAALPSSHVVSPSPTPPDAPLRAMDEYSRVSSMPLTTASPVTTPKTMMASLSKHKVYVPSSMKGACFHSYPSCPGLRSARGVSSISSQRADAMGKRPCQLCKSTRHNIALPSDDVASPCSTTLGGYTGNIIPSTPTESRSAFVPERRSERRNNGINTIPLHHSRDRPIVDGTSTVNYWTTPSGQCYHSSRTCSSLRRSRVVVKQSERPSGKRACKLCC